MITEILRFEGRVRQARKAHEGLQSLIQTGFVPDAMKEQVREVSTRLEDVLSTIDDLSSKSPVPS